MTTSPSAVFSASAGPMARPGDFVATDGRDSWSGRLASPNADGTDGPFATLERARDAMRAGELEVTYLRGGTYRLSQPLTLGPADAGVTFRNYAGETPVLSGGETVGAFRDEGNGLFSAALDRPSGLDLIVDGVRQRVAQSGAWTPDDPYRSGWLFAEAAGSKTTLRFHPGDVRPGDVAAGTMIQTFASDRLADGIAEVTGIDFATATITFGKAAQYAVDAGGTYRLLNSPALIDAPGEFAWRAADGRLVVMAADPGGFAGQTVVVPRLATLVALDGADGVTLSGLTFADTLWSGSAVVLTGADGNHVTANRFVNVGTGLTLAGSSGNRIDLNTLEHLAANGITLSGRSNANTVAGNSIRDIGAVVKDVAGIGGNGIDDNRVIHNDIDGSPRYGISIKDWNAGNANVGNLVAYNRITRTGLETADSAAIEMLGRSDIDTRAVVHGNWIDGVAGLATAAGGRWLPGHKSFGIYLDDQVNGVAVTDNFIRGTGWASVFIHGGDHNRVSNNVGILGSDQEELIRIEWGGPKAGAAGLPRDNAVTGNIAYATVPVDDYWQLFTANGPVITGNLVFNTRPYGSGDRVGDPLFADPARGDYSLSAGSPAAALGIHSLPYALMGPGGYTAPAAAPSVAAPHLIEASGRVLALAPGDQRVQGTPGIDTLAVPVARHALGVAHTPEGVVAVTPSGTMTLQGIERIRTNDGTLVVDPADPAFDVHRLYQSALGRTPDGQGLTAWTYARSVGMEMTEMARRFMDSPEFVARFGAPDGPAFVDRLYHNVLGREGDAAGHTSWVAALDSGALGREEVLVGFTGSAENIQLVASQVGTGIWLE